jgi:membrane protein DedA with SNARE-associated domain
MNITDQLLSALTDYGLPLLFVVVLIGSAGPPLPLTLLLIAAGSFVEQGEMNFWSVVLVASGGAIAGDQIGYGIGRWGGRRVAKRIGSWFGGENRIHEAEAAARKWGGVSVFLTRWLITPLGSWINLTSGISEYSWPRFLIWDVLGEVLWVVLYVSLGRIFSDRVQAASEWMGSLTWVVVGLFAIIIFGRALFKNLFRTSPSEEDVTGQAEQTNAQA